MVFSTHLDELYDTRMDCLAQTLWFGALVVHFFMAIPGPGVGPGVSGACQLWCTRSRRQVDPNILKSQNLEEWRSMKIYEDP